MSIPLSVVQLSSDDTVFRSFVRCTLLDRLDTCNTRQNNNDILLAYDWWYLRSMRLNISPNDIVR